MQDGELKPETLAFIRRYVRSIEQLEILVLLGTPPLRSWTPQAVYDIIKSNQASVEQRLRQLAEDGLIAAEAAELNAYRFQPGSEHLAQCVADLCVAYKERRVRVVEMIYSGPDPGRDLADAFRFRRKE